MDKLLQDLRAVIPLDERLSDWSIIFQNWDDFVNGQSVFKEDFLKQYGQEGLDALNARVEYYKELFHRE